MFYLIGLGLGDAKDITFKGLEAIKKCEKVYLEAYTSILGVSVENLEDFYGRKLTVADRNLVEEGASEILKDATITDVALLVVGDPFGATTHTDLVLRAIELNVPCKVIHNASIMNAVACCGLQLYSFGETVSIPYWEEHWKPDSFFDKINENFSRGLHTLCLLDIKVKEPTLESLTKKKKEYQPPRFMSVREAAAQLLQIISSKENTEKSKHLNANTLAIGIARVGGETQAIKAASLEDMKNIDLGPPLHSLVIPAATLHPLEVAFVDQFRLTDIH